MRSECRLRAPQWVNWHGPQTAVGRHVGESGGLVTVPGGGINAA